MAKKESRHRQRYGLKTIRVTGMTYYHLCCMAEAQHLNSPGKAVDKIVRTIRTQGKLYENPRN